MKVQKFDLPLLCVAPILTALWIFLESEGFYNLLAAWTIINFLVLIVLGGIVLFGFKSLQSLDPEDMVKFLDSTVETRDQLAKKRVIVWISRLIALAVIALMFWNGKFIVGTFAVVTLVFSISLGASMKAIADKWEMEKLQLAASAALLDSLNSRGLMKDTQKALQQAGVKWTTLDDFKKD